jgi:hypothetical protein
MADKETTPESLSWTVFSLTFAGAIAFAVAVAIFVW